MSNKKKYIIIAAVVVILIAVVLIIVLSGKGSSDSQAQKENESTSASENTVSSEEPTFVKMVEDEDTYLIDVGFVSLRYPKEYKDIVKVEGAKKHSVSDSFTVKFTSGKTELFVLYFNENKGNLLGTIVTEDGNSIVRVKTNVIDQTETELIKQQEALNVIIQGLISDYDFRVNEEITKEDDAVFEIKTDVVSLYYPEKWKEKVDVKIKGKTVSFVNDGTPLFDLCFEDCDGYLLGTYGDTPVYIIEHKIKGDEQAAMLQDVNVIINHLAEDKNFEIND